MNSQDNRSLPVISNAIALFLKKSNIHDAQWLQNSKNKYCQKVQRQINKGTTLFGFLAQEGPESIMMEKCGYKQ